MISRNKMMHADTNASPRLLMMVAGAKGAIGTTVALACAELQCNPGAIASSLTTADKFHRLGGLDRIRMVGWDTASESTVERIRRHGVLGEQACRPHLDYLNRLEVRSAPDDRAPLSVQVEQIRQDMRDAMSDCPLAQPVLINLLPAACDGDLSQRTETLEALLNTCEPIMPDMGYILAALADGIPIVNFSPNTVEWPVVCREAQRREVPLAGRDGKTGQTYLKVVLASALKARSLYVDGWYSLNILGNADGRNLMDPERACGKLHNKTQLLDDILGYPVGEAYDTPTHMVRIDYYPPRGDAKEAWDVIDFKGIFGMPMSLRLNLQGRDSILAAPMVIDLARWAAAAKKAHIGGPIADLGFYFKKPVGLDPSLTFQDQLAALDRLEKRIEACWAAAAAAA
jgi:myo-inositol-1-phosphate synthase